MNDGAIDYSGLTKRELLDALGSINREKFPRNYANLRKALETATDTPPPTPPIEAPAVPVRRGPRTPRLGDRAALFLFAGLVGLLFIATDLWSRHVHGPEKFSAAIIILNALVTMGISTTGFRFGLKKSKAQHTVGSVALSAGMTWSFSQQVFRYFLSTNPVAAVVGALVTDALVPLFFGWKAAGAPKEHGA